MMTKRMRMRMTTGSMTTTSRRMGADRSMALGCKHSFYRCPKLFLRPRLQEKKKNREMRWASAYTMVAAWVTGGLVRGGVVENIKLGASCLVEKWKQT